MKLKLDRGVLSFDLQDLVDAMDEKQQADLGRYLVADKQLFANVLELVATGSYNRDDEDGDWWFDRENLADLREKLIPLMGEVTRGLVEELIRQRKQAQLDERRHRDWAYKLYHAWPRDEWQTRPVGPEDFVLAPSTTEAEIDAALSEGNRP